MSHDLRLCRSRFVLQIVDLVTGEVVQWEPGTAVERLFIQDCEHAIVRRGVGWFRSTAHVSAAIREGLQQAIHELKARVRPRAGSPQAQPTLLEP